MISIIRLAKFMSKSELLYLSEIYTLNKNFQNSLLENVTDRIHFGIRDRERGMENIILSRFYKCILYKIFLLFEKLPCTCRAKTKA